MYGNLLRDIREGMSVYDRDQHKIGTVERVKFGDDDPSTPEVEATTSSEPPRQDSLIENIAEAFAPDDIPEALRQKLLQQGFVRLDTSGLFASDRYILPDQILGVSDDKVTLKVSKDELAKR
ncbi:MAG: hypothetical protein ACO1OK_03545 [Devosia sp.]